MIVENTPCGMPSPYPGIPVMFASVDTFALFETLINVGVAITIKSRKG
jgi:hypothetical protein